MGFSNRNRRQNNKKQGLISDINVTPFVDVLLVLLIIFMVAAPMMTSNIEIELPKGVSDNNDSKKDNPIYVSVKDDGSVYLQDNRVKLHNLSKQLIKITNNDLNTEIFTRADQKLNYGRVMKVISIINSAGFSKVTLVTELDK